MSLLKGAGIVGGLTLLSRIFGFVRDVVMAMVLGAGPLTDAFMVAFRLPNHFRAILAEGAFNSAFVPTYAAISEREGEASALQFRSNALSWLVLVNCLLLAIALAATGWLILLLAPGLSDDAATRNLVANLTRITFPYLGCMSVVVLFGGVLNAHGRFAAAAAAPILLNVAMASTLAIAWFFPSAAHAAAYGVLAGGVAELALLIIACRRAMLPFRAVRPKKDAAIGLFLKRFGPAVLAAGAVQLAMFADTIIATFLPSGSLSYLYYADRLYQLPLGVVGIAVGTALLPELSRRAGRSGDKTAPALLGRAIAGCILLGLPCAVVLVLLGDLIIEVLLARGAFSTAAVSGSASALAAYSLGLPPAIALRALVSGFHARGDTVTPLKALAVATVLNIVLKLVLVGTFRHVGLALATAAGVWLYSALLLLGLRARRHLVLRSEYLLRICVAAAASLAMAMTILVARRPIETIIPRLPFHLEPAAALALLGAVGSIVYLAPLLVAELSIRGRERR